MPPCVRGSNLGDLVTYMQGLEITANLAAIFTAVVAAFAYGRFLGGQCKRQKALEMYLSNEKSSGDDQGKRSVIHLMAHLAMTESEILEAAFHSTLIRTIPGVDESGKASRLLFQYDGDHPPAARHSS